MPTDVKRQLEEMQTGQYIPTEEEQTQIEEIKRTPQPGPAFEAFRLPRDGSTMMNRPVGFEAAEAGWGQSRYDRGAFVPGEDLENRRAYEQSGMSKIVNGAIKGGIFAATTAVETVAGVFDGLLEGGYELGRQVVEGEQLSVPKVVGAGVNNYVSRTMADIQQMSDRWFPNYRTAQERSDKYQDEWYKHIFTANFIGDSFLKNFGFTVGAMVGGAAWSKALGVALRSKTAGDLMKGVVAAAEGDTEAAAALENTLKVVSNGAASTIDGSAAARNISAASKSLNKMAMKHQLFGGVISAMGEGTMEGVMASNEFSEQYTNQLNQDYIQAYNELEENLVNELSGTDAVRTYVTIGSEGQPEIRRELNDKGKAILEERRSALGEDYQKKRAYADELSNRIAATTFAWNLPVLTVSNTLQFGRMLSGGFKTTRNNLSRVAGNLKKAGEKLGSDYAGTGNLGLLATRNVLKNGMSEAAEEMAQGFISSGAKHIADARMTAFNDDGYDRMAMSETGEWVNGMLEGGMEYLRDGRNWQEGFLGMITGLVGIPGRQWNGGVPEAIRDARESVRGSQAAATALNSLIGSEDFQNRWKGYVRHQKYEREMEDALQASDKYSWKTASDKQLVNDVITFANAGRLQDLKDVVSMYGNISEVDVDNLGLLDAASSEGSEKEVQNNPAKIVERVKEQAQEISQAIDTYNDMYDAMTTIAPVGTSREQIEEMIAASMNIKAFEQRFLSMFDEVIKGVEKYVLPLSQSDVEGNPLNDDRQKVQRARDIYNALAQIYTGNGLPAQTKVVDALGVMASLDALDSMIEESGDTELKEKMDDMKKVSADRKAFMKKLMTLKDLSPEKFEQQSTTPDKVVTEQKQQKAAQDTQGLNTLNDVKQAYFSKDANGRADFLRSLETVENSNQAVKDFLKLKRKYDGFRAYLDKNGVNTNDMTVTPPMIQSVVGDFIRRAQTEEDLISLPDSVFPSADEFIRDFKSIFGAPSISTFDSLKQALRDAMTSYASAETGTASRETIDPKKTKSPESEKPASKSDGYDAPQPGSVEPAPVAKKEEQPAEPEEKPEIKAKPEETQQPQKTEVASSTPSQLADDAAEAIEYDKMPDEDEKIQVEGQQDKIPYYRTSIPEIETAEARKARQYLRASREKMKDVNLADFVDAHPEYATMWNALKDRNAFENTAVSLEVGDEIEFVIDPNFPTYAGQPQILMTTVKDGQRLVLNILSGQASKYYNLSTLREKIMSDYNEFIQAHPNDMFIFSQKSRVWAKRAGIVDYDYSEDRSGEQGIINIPGYSESAPIAFIRRTGEAEVINGGDKTAVDKVSDTFNDASANMEAGNDRRGNLYYLAKVDDEKYIPIRLNVEHFNPQTREMDNPVFARIRKQLSDIAEIVQNTTEDNLEEQNEKMRSVLSKLSDSLDLSNTLFKLDNFGGIGIGLRITPDLRVPTEERDDAIRKPDQITNDWLIKYIAGLDRSLQIRQNEDGSITNFSEYVENGLITSNARRMYPKGTDFYINPWVGDKFAPVTDSQREAMEEIPTAISQTEPLQPEPTRDFFGMDEFADMNEADEDYGDEEEMPESEDDVNMFTYNEPFSVLTSSLQSLLLAKGHTEEEWNGLSPALREKILKCL